MLSKYEKHCMQTVAFVKEQHERWLKFDKGPGGKFLEPSRWHPICPHFQNQFLSSSDLISSSKESRNGLKGTCAGTYISNLSYNFSEKRHGCDNI